METHNPPCRLIQDDGFIKVIMPDGKIIPHQLDIEIQQKLEDHGMALVKVELYVAIDSAHFVAKIDNNCDKITPNP